MLPALSAKQIKAGAKEVITSKEDFLQFDRFKFGSADILYDPNHHYCIGRLARVILDAYSQLLGAREKHYYENGEFATYTNVDVVPAWIREDFFAGGRCDTAPYVPGKRYMYTWDWEPWFEWKFLGGAKPLWD